jgi:hypothetical protein
MNEGDVVHDGAERFNNFTEELAALAIRAEGEGRLHPWPQTILEGFDFFAETGGFAMVFFEKRFVVPEIKMAGGPAHEQLDNAANFRGMMEHFKGAA